jgi:hypothetical protein
MPNGKGQVLRAPGMRAGTRQDLTLGSPNG